MNLLRSTYKLMALLGLIGAITTFAIAGLAAGLSFLSGAIILFIITFSWDASTGLIFDENDPQPKLGTLFIFLRYALLGLVIYSMMALFVIKWAWFIAGTLVFVLSLLFVQLFSKFQNGER